MSKHPLQTRTLPRPGDVVADKYEVDAVLGTGAMGVVVSAVHRELGQRVAIKFMRPEIGGDDSADVRFLREARAAAAIQSQHVVRVYDVARLDDGTPYLVMEHLSGTDLHKLSSRLGALPIREVVAYVLQACEALAEVHAAGIVHRDLKPGNLFLARRGDGRPLVKVLDFGISKMVSSANSLAGPSDPSLTLQGEIVGSVHYMSPEQLKSPKDVDGRADIWALGAIMYQLVTGKAPFPGDTIASCMYAILNATPEPVSSLRPDAPPELDRVIQRCLEKDVSARFQHVGELASALAALVPLRAHVSSVERIRGVLIGSDAISEDTRYFATIASLTAESERAAAEGASAPAGALEAATADLGVAAPILGAPVRGRSDRSRSLLLVAGGLAAGLAIGAAAFLRLLPGARGAAAQLPEVAAVIAASPQAEPAQTGAIEPPAVAIAQAAPAAAEAEPAAAEVAEAAAEVAGSDPVPAGAAPAAVLVRAPAPTAPGGAARAVRGSSGAGKSGAKTPAASKAASIAKPIRPRPKPQVFQPKKSPSVARLIQ